MSLTRFLVRTLAAIFSSIILCTAHAALITSESLIRPEGARHYLLAQSANTNNEKRPLVIVLHGHGSNASTTLGKNKNINDPAAGWLDVVDRENVLVVVPDGWKGSDDKQGWNDCRADASTNPNTDDVGFIAALIDKAIAGHDVDPQRVFVTGMSNGGVMTYRLAIELGPRIAAIAVGLALMPVKSRCPVMTHPMPILITHGTDDKIAPYAGGEVGHWLLHGRGSGIPVEDSVKFWLKVAQLPDSPVITKIPHRDKSDPTSATRYVWGDDPAKMQIAFFKISKGGHCEPSIAKRLSWLIVSLMGEQNADVEFVEESWTFFKDKRSNDGAK